MPNGGGHIASPFRLAPVLGAGLALFATGVAAQDTSLASDTMRICEANPAFDAAAHENLTNLGWSEVATDAVDGFRTQLADGALIVLRTVTEPVDWEEAPVAATAMADGLFDAATETSFTMFSHPEGAALLVVDLSDDTSWISRCLFGGPEDAEQSLVFDTVARADEGVGITQGDPHVHSYSMHNVWVEGNKRLEMSLQAARFLPTAMDQLGREPSVDMGFSLFAIAEK